MPCLAKIVNKRIDGSIYLFQEILQTSKESSLFTIHYYNKGSIQNNNANNCQQYEELRVSENGYHNIKLRN